MLSFDTVQMHAFRRTTQERWCETLAREISILAPAHFQAMTRAGAEAFADAVMQRAAAHGIRQQQTSFLWLEASLLWGIGFASDPLFSNATDMLKSSDDEVRRMQVFHAAFLSWHTSMCGENGELFSKLLERLDRFEEGAVGSTQKLDTSAVTAVFATIWPERAACCGAEALRLCAAAGLKEAAKLGVSARSEVLTVAALRFILGAEWARDPQYAWFVRDISTPEGLPSRARAYLREARKHAVL